jgi:telomerase reverse transcriptase
MKSTRPLDLGGSLFSVGDIYPRLKSFYSGLKQAGLSGRQLFFAKVDVQACFDTVPQQSLIEVITALISAESYHINQHAEVKQPEPAPPGQNTIGPKSKIKFDGYARPGNLLPSQHCHDPIAMSDDQGTTVAVGPLGQQSYRKQKILSLLKEHVEYNVVKIGKKYYRQKNGIPQGSVLSSLLCSFFYGKLEKEVLGFLRRPDTILLRLIDDFLLITTERAVAEKFLDTMHQGVPDYGISVKAQKSLVNFDYRVGSYQIPQCEGSSFPYCGLCIDTVTFNLKRDAERKSKMGKRTQSHLIYLSDDLSSCL